MLRKLTCRLFGHVWPLGYSETEIGGVRVRVRITNIRRQCLRCRANEEIHDAE